jgi:hypothetical protein
VTAGKFLLLCSFCTVDTRSSVCPAESVHALSSLQSTKSPIVYHFCLLHTRQSLENLLASSADQLTRSLFSSTDFNQGNWSAGGTCSLMWVPRGETCGVQKNLYSTQLVLKLKTCDTICEEDNCI